MRVQVSIDATRCEKFEEIFQEIPHLGDARRPQSGHHGYSGEALGPP